MSAAAAVGGTANSTRMYQVCISSTLYAVCNVLINVTGRQVYQVR